MVLGGLKTLFLCLPLCLTFNDVLGLVCDREEDNTSGSETERERDARVLIKTLFEPFPSNLFAFLSLPLVTVTTNFGQIRPLGSFLFLTKHVTTFQSGRRRPI